MPRTRSLLRAVRPALLVVGLFVLTTPAYALPTPDVIASTLNVVPLIIGLIVAFLGGLVPRFKATVENGGARFLAGAILGFALPATVLFGIWISSIAEDARQRKIRDLGIYLRCDFGAHEKSSATHGTRRDARIWARLGRFHAIEMNDIAARLAEQPDAALIATYPKRIRYESGIPAVQHDGDLVPFEYSRPMELPRTLEKIHSKDLYLVGFEPFSRRPASYPTLTPIFRKFDNIYVVGEVRTEQRYVRGDDGALRPADDRTPAIDWPVREEDWLLDETAVNYPQLGTLLEDATVARLLRDDDVLIVAPYNGYLRNARPYLHLYIDKLLDDVSPERLHTIDLQSATTTRELEAIAAAVDRRPFVVVGLTKYDYIYNGVDAAFAIWDRLGRDPDRFRLLGFTPRLPEVVAINWVDDKRRGVIDSLAGPFWAGIGMTAAGLGISSGAAIFVFAVLLRLLLLPIGVRESRSRLIRSRVEREISGGARPVWAGSSRALLQALGVRGGWELAGAALTLALILPAYELLSGPASPVLDESLLWIARLGDPDAWLSILVGGLVGLKILLGSERARARVVAATTFAFTLLLLFVPAVVLVYVGGVLAVTTIQELSARREARRVLERALLRLPEPA